MTTKDTLYRFLKSAKQEKCKSLGAISSMNKQQMLTLAYKLGFSPTENRLVYNKNYDKSTSSNPITTRPRTTRLRRQPQEEKKEETWQEMKQRALKIIDEAKKIMNKVSKKQDTTNRDLTKSKEYKNAIDMRMKGSKLLSQARELEKKEKEQKKK